MTDSRPRSPHLAAFAAAAACLGFAAWIGLRGPEGVLPVHIQFDGTVDRWGDRTDLAWALAVPTVFLLAIYGLTAHSLSKAAESSVRGLAMVQAILIGMMLFVVAIIGSITYGDYGAGSDPLGPVRPVGALAGAIMLLFGSVLGKIAPNPWVGVRTYWALTSRTAWDKSNRLVGRLWFWCGLVALPAALLGPQPHTTIGITAVLLITALAGVFESWRVWNADPERRAA